MFSNFEMLEDRERGENGKKRFAFFLLSGYNAHNECYNKALTLVVLCQLNDDTEKCTLRH